MKNQWLVILPLFITFSVIGQNSDTENIRVHLETMFRDFDHEDYEHYYGLLHPEVIITSQTGNEIRGPEAVKKYFNSQLPILDIRIHEMDIISNTVSGDLAVSHLHVLGSFSEKDKPENPPSLISDHYVWKKMDGKWTIYRNSWSGLESHDEVAIKKCINDATQFFYKGDYENWKNTWLDADYIVWTVTPSGNPGAAIRIYGFDDLSKTFKGWMDGRPVRNVGKNMVHERDNWIIEVRDDVAFVTFEDNVTNTNPDGYKGLVYETRVLEKIDGTWKMVQLNAIFDFKNATPQMRSKY